jgi:hypothetical protein
LRAFLQRYASGIDSLVEFSLAWNGAREGQDDWTQLWQALETDMPRLARRADEWRREMLAHGDLANNMLNFARSLRSAAQ